MMTILIIALALYFFPSIHLAGGVLQQVNYDLKRRGLLKSYLFMLFLGPAWLTGRVIKKLYRKYFVTDRSVFEKALKSGQFEGMTQVEINEMELNSISKQDREFWNIIKEKYGYKARRDIRRKMSKV